MKIRSANCTPFGPLALAAALAAAVVATGCNQGPAGNTGGRTDPYRSEGVPNREVNTADLLAASDKTAEAIASRISDVARAAGRQTKMVIELGLIENKTRTPSSDFDLIRRRLSDRLVNSDVVRKVAMIMDAPERMDEQAARFEQTKPVDRLDEDLSSGGSATSRYDAKDTFLLNGYFGEAVRTGGAFSQYFFQMKLVNLQTREVLFSDSFEVATYR